MKIIKMHRAILAAPMGVDVDHIDGNRLNNQKSNLRLCSNLQNSRNKGIEKRNTSGFKGVSWDRRNNKWRAQIRFNKRSICLGGHSNIIDAANAYDAAAIRYFGEFARTNKMIRSYAATT